MASIRPDLEILDRVRAALRSERLLGPGFRAEHLEIDDDGALILEGEAPSVAAKKLALRHVAALDGVEAIVDRLRVHPASAMGDAEIRAHLRRALRRDPSFQDLELREMHHEAFQPAYRVFYDPVAGDPATSRGRIDIEIRDGVVTLNGAVPGLNSKRWAGVLAWWIPGVRDVVNGLAVEPPEEDAPIRIEEAVRFVLEKDPFVDASQIRVGVRNREVRLTGLLPSAELRDMAERDAWCVFGVDNVINDIEAPP